MSVIGGRIPNVGVGGLILGGQLPSKFRSISIKTKGPLGGFFHFSGEYGLASDNVKNFEVFRHNPLVLYAL